jgi:WD40 repeat protein
MMVLDAQVLETELCKLVAFGGDTQRAIVYQYDVVAQSDSDLKQLALYELTGGSVARLGSPKVVHDDDAKQTPRSVSIKPSASADGSSPPGEVARRLSFHALMAWATGDVHEAGDGPSRPQEPSIVRIRMPKSTEPAEVTRKARVVNVGGVSVDSHTDSDAKMPDDRDGADEEPRKNMMVAKLIFRKEYLQTLRSVSLSGNTQRLAVGDARGAVRVHDFSTDSEVFSWNDANQVFGVSLSYSGQHLATCGAAKSTRIFDVESGAETYHRVARDRLRAVALSHSGKVCVIGGFDGTVHACDIQAGARIQTFEQHEIVRSVATDASGLILAVGCDDGRCSLYDLGVPGADITTPPRWAVLHDSKVWVVDVSRDGRLVAAGDYANVVRVYSADDGTPVWEKNSWLGKGAPYTWGLSFSGDSSTLAIGHWDSYAYIVDTETWTELAQLKRGDRVYSVSLDHEGKHLAVGGRDKVAAVYDIQRVSSTNGLRPNRHSANVFVANIHKASTNVKTTATINVGAFIYAVSLSNDGRRLAVGTVDSMVGLYLVGSQELLHSMRHQGSIQSVAFSPDANYLAVGGEQNAVTVWTLSEDKGVAPRQYLVLPRSSSVHSVAFSDVGLAFGSGSLATVYGGHQDAEWTDRPSFEVIADIMEHPNALTRLIEQHPTVLHLTNPMGGESLLQHTVRKRPASKVEMLLKTGCRFGLIEDARGHTALMIALKNERKPIVRMLLHSIAVSSRDQSTALKQFMRHREEIADKYPDLFLEFIQNIDLIVEDELAPQGQNIALLKSAADIITAGSEELRPIRLWDDLMELPATVSGKPSGRGQNTQRRHSILSSDPTRQRQSNKDLEVKIIPEGCKKVEVTAIRVPLEGVVSQTLEHIAQPQRTLLFLISHAAGELDDYHIFNTLLVRAMLQYKWHSYAQFVFVLQFYGFLVLLACTCLSAYALPRLCLASTCMDAAKICSLCIEADEGDGSCDHFPRLAYSGSFLRYDPDDDPDRSISTLWNTALGRMAFLTLVASQLGCLFGISLEFRQVSLPVASLI